MHYFSPLPAVDRAPMTEWLHAEYRDFDRVPRAMVCTSEKATYYFVSRIDAERGVYRDWYEVYRIDPMEDGEVCLSWFGLETRARERLPDLPVGEFPFDVAARQFLPYYPIASKLGE